MVPFRAVVDGIEEPFRYSDRFSFQKVRTQAGQHGWLTYRDGSTIYLIPADPGPVSDDGARFRVDWQEGLRLRSEPEPGLDSAMDVNVAHGTIVVSQGEAFTHIDGYVFQRVKVPDGRIGWLTRSYGDIVYLVRLEDDDGGADDEDVVTGTLWVVWPDGLKLRSEPEPTLDSFLNVIVPYGTQILALGEPSDHGDGYRFQKVTLPEGMVGWLTLSFGDTVYLSNEEPDLSVQPVHTAQVSEVAGMWAEMRDAPGGAASWWVGGAVPLRVIDPISAGAKIGHAGQWVEVETPAFKRGYIEGRNLKQFVPSQNQLAVRQGESPFIYGFHDRYDRSKLEPGVTGWVLLTYGLGLSGDQAGGDRHTFYDWSRHGFGVIARLNHGYESAGTIPDPQHFDAFAATCAAFVKQSIDPENPNGGCHIWIIGNEMNNPREYPGNNQGSGGRPISPESYADCFNRTYQAIKDVYTAIPGLSKDDGVVVPGAVDPYNAQAGCNGEWLTRMLRHIEKLDGFALHSYTHGTEPGLITNRKLFGQEHNLPVRFPDHLLSWQYYNFYAYRTYMDLIPLKWRDVPVFLTETDQVQEQWNNENSGWVKGMYAEIDRWNSDPNRQRICCSLLFRWEAFDGKWQIKGKGGVLQDFTEATRMKYRW